MKKITFLLVFIFCLPALFYAQYVGIGTETPTAMLDINGDVVFRTHDMVIEDSIAVALDVNTEKFSSYRIDGDSAFTIAGLTAGVDGRVVTLINESEFPMELSHDDTTALEEDRIFTGDHENLVLDAMGMVTLQYDTSAQKWLVNSSNQTSGETVWDTAGSNIYFENFVGIGTEDPTVPLDIQTEVDEIGFSHMAGEDSITVASTVSEYTGSVGTTTDHVFSLNAGGEGKMHVWPNGNVLIGSNALGFMQSRMNELDSKLTVTTPINEMGFTHIGGDDEIRLSEGFDAWFDNQYGYIGTQSDHPFRLRVGSIGNFVNLFPTHNGQMVLGEILHAPHDNAKITIYSGTNTDGITQIGTQGQRIAMRIGGSSCAVGTWSDHILRLTSNSVGRMHVLPNGNITVSPNDYADHGKFTVYQEVEGEKGIVVVTPNNTNGVTQYGASGQVLAMRVGGPFGSAGLGTYSDTHLRLQCNSQNAINVISPSLNVGIGIDFPSEKLTVRTPAGGFGVSHRADGGEVLTTHIAGGATSIGTWSNHPFRLRCNSQDVINLTTDAKVGIGTWTPQQKLDVNGTIRSKEIIVELINWPDYVFHEDYKLTSLHELEKFIEENNHLPNIPSAKEVESNGQYVGALQQKMMEKIEELTLHIIELNKRIEVLEKENQE